MSLIISYYRKGKKHTYRSTNTAHALERKAQLLAEHGRGAWSGCSWFTIETPESQPLGFLQKEAL